MSSASSTWLPISTQLDRSGAVLGLLESEETMPAERMSYPNQSIDKDAASDWMSTPPTSPTRLSKSSRFDPSTLSTPTLASPTSPSNFDYSQPATPTSYTPDRDAFDANDSEEQSRKNSAVMRFLNYAGESSPPSFDPFASENAFDPFASENAFDPVVGSYTKSLTKSTSPTYQFSPSLLPSHGPIHSNSRVFDAQPSLDTALSLTRQEEVATRYVIVGNIPHSAARGDLERIFATPYDAKGIFDGHLRSHGLIVIVFEDVRDAVRAVASISNDVSKGIKFAARCIARDDVQIFIDYQPNSLLSHSEGVIAISLRSPTLTSFPYSASSFKAQLETFGAIRSFRTIELESIHVVEFFDERDADKARNAWNGFRNSGCEFTCVFEPTVATTDLLPWFSPATSSFFQTNALSQHRSQSQPNSTYNYRKTTSAQDLNRSPSRFLSPSFEDESALRNISNLRAPERVNTAPIATGIAADRRSGAGRKKSCWQPDREEEEISKPDISQSQNVWTSRYDTAVRSASSAAPQTFASPSSTKPPRSIHDIRAPPFSAPSSQNVNKRFGIYRDEMIPISNVLDFDRIQRGAEMRTTLMIRNIPNRLDAEGLMDMITEIVPNSFDFFYLRIDFSNSCNVGYAFVNFLDVESLYSWAKARVGTRWNCFASDKVVVASFANVQGKEALITKFRSSSVMDEVLAFRPRLFYSDGPFQGQPEPFPVCDNYRKKARSHTNAHSVGLFPPNKPIFKLTECLSNLNM